MLFPLNRLIEWLKFKYQFKTLKFTLMVNNTCLEYFKFFEITCQSTVK